MFNMKALSLSVQKLMPSLSFIKSRLIDGGQGHGINNFGTSRKVFPHSIFMHDMKAQSLSIQKFLLRLSFSKVCQKSR